MCVEEYHSNGQPRYHFPMLADAPWAVAPLMEALRKDRINVDFRTDHDETDVFRLAEADQGGNILTVDIDALRVAGNAAIARGAIKVVDRWRFAQCPAKRVLPPTGADDEDIHEIRFPLMACSALRTLCPLVS